MTSPYSLRAITPSATARAQSGETTPPNPTSSAETKSSAAQALLEPQPPCGPPVKYQTSSSPKGKPISGCCRSGGMSGSTAKRNGSPNRLTYVLKKPEYCVAASQLSS